MIDQAAAAGMQWPGTYSLGPTLAAVGALLTFGMWSWFSVALSGEIKGGATRKQWYAMLWATLIQYAIFIVMTVLLYKTVGQQFIASVNYLSTANPAAYALPAPPYLVLLTSVIPGGFIVPFLISFAFIAWIPLVHFIQFIQAIRALFAMAFDRVVPAKLGDVNERTHAPITGLIVCTIIGVVCLIWAVFSPTLHDRDRHRRTVRHPAHHTGGHLGDRLPLPSEGALQLFCRPRSRSSASHWW